MIEFMEKERGISQETLDRFGVSVDAGGAMLFPYGDQQKGRRHDPDGKRHFFFPKGGTMALFTDKDAVTTPTTFLVEGETDTMRLAQELEFKQTVCGLPGIEHWKDEYAEQLKHAEHVLVIFDNDQDYNVKSRVDKAWRSIRTALGTRAKRVQLPTDVKDLCEFFDRYSLDTLRMLASRSPGANKSRFPNLDLTQEPPPVRWLVDSMFCRGDVHLLIGEPGIGKSWLTMALAVAIADKWPDFLGRPIKEHGKVLYLDEENPEDLVFDRFSKLGLTPQTARNIRYINNVGVRLDRNPDEFVDEAIDYDPSLIVLDSLTRLHTEDENHAGAMASLFHNAIKPLARETSAAVVLIHHANKTDTNSSYRRSRGSGDITASVDCGYDVRELGQNQVSIANFKSRRQAQGETVYVTIKDKPDGHVALVVDPTVF
jgi:KaiC/GvpD/RAD55 family RecA-like ATPase